MSLLRDPLLHFVVAGTILFAAFAAFRGDEPTDLTETIVVDRRALLTFLQYRANAFDPEIFGAALNDITDGELQEVIDAYVDEEILYREAQQLGLEASDNIIRQRMVQKMNFLMTDIAAADLSTDSGALEAYFVENLEAYAVQPWATFTHIFFDTEKHGAEGAHAAAEDAKHELNAARVQFNDAPGLGDNFPFLRNYVERTFEYVAGQFGYEFVAAIEAIGTSENEWQGPFQSVYGQHIVLMIDKAERAYPDLDDVRSTVERDLANELSNEALDQMTREIRERYDIQIGEIRSGSAQ